MRNPEISVEEVRVPTKHVLRCVPGRRLADGECATGVLTTVDSIY